MINLTKPNKNEEETCTLVAFAAAMLTPTVVWAQYPQITDEAKANIQR